MNSKTSVLGPLLACVLFAVPSMQSTTTSVPEIFQCPLIKCEAPDPLLCPNGYDRLDANGCPTCTCWLSSANNCPAIPCEYIIYDLCPNGPELDENGCPTCRCKGLCPPLTCPYCSSVDDIYFDKDAEGCVKCLCQLSRAPTFQSARLLSVAPQSLLAKGTLQDLSSESVSITSSCTKLQCVFECRLSSSMRSCGSCGITC